jgi:hypothetical protein
VHDLVLLLLFLLFVVVEQALHQFRLLALHLLREMDLTVGSWIIGIVHQLSS